MFRERRVFSGGVRFEYGRESPVSTVPGCRPTTMDCGRSRACSMESVFSSMFNAAFDARYEYQPPSRLSPMLPTRADNAAKTVLEPLRSLGRKCFATIAGPTALMARTWESFSASSSRMLFSGLSVSPDQSIPVATTTISSGDSDEAIAAHVAIDSSSAMSSLP